MKQSTFDDIIVAILGMLIIGLILGTSFAINYFVSAKQCHSRYEASGWKSQYGVWTGCLVDQGDGKLLPSTMLREVIK